MIGKGKKVSDEKFEKDPNVEHLREAARKFCEDHPKPTSKTEVERCKSESFTEFNNHGAEIKLNEKEPWWRGGKEVTPMETAEKMKKGTPVEGIEKIDADQETVREFKKLRESLPSEPIVPASSCDVQVSSVRPDYYKSEYEPKDVIRAWNLNFNLGNVVKYVARAGKKPDNSRGYDLRKAKQYIEFELEYIDAHREEGENEKA